MALIYVGPQRFSGRRRSGMAGLGKFKLRNVVKAITQISTPHIPTSLNPKDAIKEIKADIKDKADLAREIHDAITPEAVKRLEDKAKKALPKILPIIAVIASIVAVFFPIIAPAIPYLRAAGVAAAAYQKKQDYDAAKKAQKEFDDQKANMVATLVNEGLTNDQATRIVDLIVAGAEPDAAMRTILGERVQMTVPADSALLNAPGTQQQATTLPRSGGDYSIMPVMNAPTLQFDVMPAAAPQPANLIQTNTPAGGRDMPIPADQAKVQFMRWLHSFNPQLYAAVVREHPEIAEPQASMQQAMSGMEVDSFTGDYEFQSPDRLYSTLSGLGDFDLSWIDSVSSAVGKLSSTYFDAQTVKLQLERAKQSLAPAPTSQVTQVAAQQTKAAGQPVPFGASVGLSTPMMIGLGVGGLGLVGLIIFLSSRRRSRR